MNKRLGPSMNINTVRLRKKKLFIVAIYVFVLRMHGLSVWFAKDKKMAKIPGFW